MARGEQACRAVEEKLPPRRDGLPRNSGRHCFTGPTIRAGCSSRRPSPKPAIKKQGCLAPLAGQIDNVVS